MLSIGKKNRVIIIAEISANHGRSFTRAVSLVQEAKRCGADAVKFQAYTPDTITLDMDSSYFKIRHPEWGGQTLYQLYKKAYTPWNWLKKLKKVSDDLGMAFFATAFDKTAVDFLEGLDVKVHKISSFELVDLPLIEYAAGTKKPLILSTGMASIAEIKDAVAAARGGGASEIALLKCVSSYPADPREMNLRTIGDMKERFGCPVGLSDHTLGIGASLAAVTLGAVIIEKHFTLSRKIKTPDSFFSVEPGELKVLADNIRLIENALGHPSYRITAGQKRSLGFRRSIFAVKDIKAGGAFTEENIRSIRPAKGLRPKYLKDIIGKKAGRAIKRGTPLQWKLISSPETKR